MGIVGHQRDRLTILSILLNSEGHFKFLRDFHWICDKSSLAIIEFPIRGNKSLDDTFARSILVFLDVGLSFLCIFCAT